ncbi:uncharacterized protein LOC122390024 [Amphibalanus amphitrite]|uniref:uncharacterized protein LOC122390024 n=1 Tax=Amphibalanus amphitrite TaxID=1232801 RepID=UPI001C914802|nr:uncharacterized protein LOC122390024 [Amphibalanus amphitrite]XP_043238523.1 uncharacterized protein LOC122390024 [Amphibalanus amphitrite]
MKVLGVSLAVMLFLHTLAPARALYLNRNTLDDAPELRPRLSGGELRQLGRLSGGELRQLGRLTGGELRQLTAGRQRRSRLPLCKRVKQEVPPICADDVECQRHYLQYVNNMVRMLDAGRRRRR